MKDSKYYVEMDVHKAATVITVLNSAGKQMKSIVETKANTILDVVKGLRGEIHLIFEEGTHSSWSTQEMKN